MDANTQNISEATIALIDSLKSTTSHFGLANSGGEYKIITEMFLYKYFNDKFGYEAKQDKIYGERLRITRPIPGSYSQRWAWGTGLWMNRDPKDTKFQTRSKVYRKAGVVRRQAAGIFGIFIPEAKLS